MKAMDVDARFAAQGRSGMSGFGRDGLASALEDASAFKGAIAAAFATGAYVLAISSMWLLADAVGFWRLLLLMVTAIVAMVVWIIIAHHLWERHEDRERREWASLYNGVAEVPERKRSGAVGLAILFALLFVAAWVFVPGSYFKYPQAPYRVPEVT